MARSDSFSRYAQRSLRAALAWLGLGTCPASAAELLVPEQFARIQDAIAAAADGDVVRVGPGTYYENLDFLGKAITVQSERGFEVTVIDGRQRGPVVRFTSGEGRASVLRGFTITHGLARASEREASPSQDGGGLRIVGASPTIESNLIAGNVALGTGGGILVEGGAPLIRDNGVVGNAAQTAGGIGVGFSDAVPPTEITANLIANNLAAVGGGGGIWLRDTSSVPRVRGNLIQNNEASGSGGGIVIESVGEGGADVANNWIIANRARAGGGIALNSNGSRASAIVHNTIVENSSKKFGSALYMTGDRSRDRFVGNVAIAQRKQVAIFCEDFRFQLPSEFSFNSVTSTKARYSPACGSPHSTNGNTDLAPGFIAPSANNYHLRADSPLIDAAGAPDPVTYPTDADGDLRVLAGKAVGGALADIGADEFAPGAPMSLGLSPARAALQLGTQHCVTATAADERGQPASDFPIEFSITGPSAQQPTVIRTDAAGTARFCYDASERFVGDDEIQAEALRGATPSASALLAVQAGPSIAGCRIRWKGQMQAPSDLVATLGGSASVNKRGKSRGSHSYREPRDHTQLFPQRFSARSTKTEGVTCDADSAVILGRAKLRDRSRVGFRLELLDGGALPNLDRYRLQLSNGFDSGEQPLTRGDVRIKAPPAPAAPPAP